MNEELKQLILNFNIDKYENDVKAGKVYQTLKFFVKSDQFEIPFSEFREVQNRLKNNEAIKTDLLTIINEVE